MPQENVFEDKMATHGLQPLCASRLIRTYTSSPKTVPSPDSPQVLSGESCTDHMIVSAMNI